MKKNVFAALVILFITVAFLVVVNDLSQLEKTPVHANVHKAHQKADLVGLDGD